MRKIRLGSASVRAVFGRMFFIFVSGAAFFPIPQTLGLSYWSSLSIKLVVVLFLYLGAWWWVKRLRVINIVIGGSRVTIKEGDIFSEPEWKAIGFNEYFDTKVDDKVISRKSLNGIFIENHLQGIPVSELDRHIEEALKGKELRRTLADERRCYELGTVCPYKDYLLTSLSKFDEDNRANLTIPEYVDFLIRFWNEVDSLYNQKSVSVPIFGSGITRIHGGQDISEEDLLRLMLLTLKVSNLRLKHPAKLNIIIHKDKIDKVNLLEIKSSMSDE